MALIDRRVSPNQVTLWTVYELTAIQPARQRVRLAESNLRTWRLLIGSTLATVTDAPPGGCVGYGILGVTGLVRPTTGGAEQVRNSIGGRVGSGLSHRSGTPG